MMTHLQNLRIFVLFTSFDVGELALESAEKKIMKVIEHVRSTYRPVPLSTLLLPSNLVEMEARAV
eukprot:5120397-Amphidinium_carterae.1